jgi:hypothetical protein
MHAFLPRVPGNGEVALESANMEYKHGDVLPSDAQEVTDPFGDVPNSALNEELVKSTSTTSTSSSNIEDDAPPSEKGDSDEGIVYHCHFPRTSGCARAELLCGDMHDFLNFAFSFTSLGFS